MAPVSARAVPAPGRVTGYLSGRGELGTNSSFSSHSRSVSVRACVCVCSGVGGGVTGVRALHRVLEQVNFSEKFTRLPQFRPGEIPSPSALSPRVTPAQRRRREYLCPRRTGLFRLHGSRVCGATGIRLHGSALFSQSIYTGLLCSVGPFTRVCSVQSYRLHGSALFSRTVYSSLLCSVGLLTRVCSVQSDRLHGSVLFSRTVYTGLLCSVGPFTRVCSVQSVCLHGSALFSRTVYTGLFCSVGPFTQVCSVQSLGPFTRV